MQSRVGFGRRLLLYIALHLPAEHRYHAVLRDVGSPPYPLGFELDHKPHSVAMDRVADRPQAARRAVGGFRPLDGKTVIFAFRCLLLAVSHLGTSLCV